MNRTVIKEVASLLSIPDSWLYNLIYFESKGNPQAENPYTKAKGLIQFMPKTAQWLGFKDQFDLVKRYPDFESQLKGPVYNYLQRYKPFTTEQSFYMSVFYPKYRYVPLNTEFNSIVQKYNPGIKTVKDYVKKVNPGFQEFPLLLIVILSGIYYFYNKFS